MQKIRQAHGNWVSGPERFWGRETELANFCRYLDEGANLLLVAQRRMGKTSLMREAARRIDNDYLCLHLDVQNCSTAEDFVAELGIATNAHASLWHRTKAVFSNVVDSARRSVETLQLSEIKITIRAGLVAANWESKADELLQEIANQDKATVLFIDEVPILVGRILWQQDSAISSEGIQAADRFMSWLRSKALQHANQIRFVLTGSIGLEPLLRRVNLSAAINNLKPFHLEPWDEQTALGCLRALANYYEIRLSEEICLAMIRRLGCNIPHHVQMYFSHVYESCKRRSITVCTRELVDDVYEKYMLSSRGHAELSTFEERLAKMIAEDCLPFAFDLLTETAIADCLDVTALKALAAEHDLNLGRPQSKVRLVLDILEHDGYLKRRQDEYYFVSHLLRDWWKARHGFGYVPTQQRGAN